MPNTDAVTTRTITTSRHPRSALGITIGLLIGILVVVAPTPSAIVPLAGAVNGDAKPTLTVKSTPQTTAVGGDLIHYAINYTCSNSSSTPPIDGCDGALFADPLPKFPNVYGVLQPLDFISANGPASVWPSGFSLDSSDPANPKVVATAGTWNPGSSGTIFVNAQVPLGMVPVASQPVSNTATVTDPLPTPFVDSSTTATTTISGVAPSWTVSKLGPTTSRMNKNYQWVVSVCTTNHSTLWPVFDVTDTLPAGTQFVSTTSSGVYTDDGDTPAESDGAGVVAWHFDATNRPPLTSDGCFRMTVVARFPVGYIDPTPSVQADDDNIGGAHKTDVATADGRNTPLGAPTSLGTAPRTTVLQAASFGLGDGGTAKAFTDANGADNFYVHDTDPGRFRLSGRLDSDLPADTFVISDGSWNFDNGIDPPTSGVGMPQSFTASGVVPGHWGGGLLATIEGSDDGFATFVTIATGVASDDSLIPLATPYRSIRWVFGSGPDSVPGDFDATGLQIVGNVGAPSNAFGLYTNTSTMTVTRAGSADIVTQASDQYVYEPALPLPVITKSVADAHRQPGQTDVYTISIADDGDATGALTNPYIEDCVPAHFVVQGSPALGAGWSIGTPAPSCAPGETPYRFDYAGTLQPGSVSATITYTVLVAGSTPGPVAPFGEYDNTATIFPSGGGAFGHCRNTSPVCGSVARVTIDPTVELSSKKCVSGDLDAGIFRPTPNCDTSQAAVTSAQTLPGGVMMWQLRLLNSGNTDATNVDFVDIFPHVGDTAVVTTTNDVLNTRLSEFDPYLTSPITAPAGWTVSYSTSDKPCRAEVGGPTSSCDAPGWVTNPSVLDVPTFKSVKFTFSGVLDQGDTAVFGWTMRASVNDATYDENGINANDPYEFLRVCSSTAPPTDATHCPRAVNSFAYGADATNLAGAPQPSRLFAEPPQVEIRVVAPPQPNGVGDRVWFDRDFDGIQSPDHTASGEPGIPGVLVELFAQGNPTALYSTYTDADGEYFFSGGQTGLPDGDYVVRFHPPAGYHVSPVDRTGLPGDHGAQGTVPPLADANTGDDSDVSRTVAGTDANGAYYETPVITLGDTNNTNLGQVNEGEIDLTWDMGLWAAIPAVQIDKVTQDSSWPSSDAGDAVMILRGRPVTWRYTITNTGNTRLQNVVVTDDAGPDADFTVSNCSITTAGTNAEGLTSSAVAPIALNRGAVMQCTATAAAAHTSNYSNTATVSGSPRLDDGTVVTAAPDDFAPIPTSVTDTDPSSYVSGKYDLALAKTGSITLASGTVAYTIVVKNEGTVPSGAYSVTDVVPNGLVYDSAGATPSAVVPTTSITGGVTTLNWTNLASLAAGASQTLTIVGHVADYKTRPWRNYAEITADSSASVHTGASSTLTPTLDYDSTPDADITNDNTGNGVALGNGYGAIGSADATVDNANITEAGSRLFPDPSGGDDAKDGEDDADIADLPGTLTYDLALSKEATTSPVGLGVDPSFTVRVFNQGNVPSGQVVVEDHLPTGLTFVATGSAAGCVAGAGQVVTCTIAAIAPNASVAMLVKTSINGTPRNYSTAPWRNWAEISSDSGQSIYALDDKDSVPELTEANGIGQDGTKGGDVYLSAVAGATYTAPGTAALDSDDNDDAIVTTTVVYDLALAKTVANVNVAAGTMDYTVTVQNQGTVASGAYTVTDHLPPGLALTGTPTPTPTTTTGTTATGLVLTYDMTTLAASASATITFSAHVIDYKVQPFRNIAEISADSGQALYHLDDRDSTPDTNVANDGTYGTIGSSTIDNLVIADAGTGADPQDDADIADVTLNVVYDLALAKLPAAASIALNGRPTFQVTVYNQGTVPSGAFTVQDQIPTGLTFTATGSTAGCTAADSVVTCTSAGIEPGTSTVFTLVTTVDGSPANYSTAPWRNWAEIATDSASSLYGKTDVDSTPLSLETSGTTGHDNTLPNDAYRAVTVAGASYVAPAGGPDEDDNDDAVVTTSVVYDLALVKTVANVDPATGLMDYTITIQNQGSVPSGAFTVTDDLPTGVALQGASTPATASSSGGVLTWNLAGIGAGASTTITFTGHIADYTARPFRNIAEISSDSAIALYGIADRDSTPDAVTTNDGTYGTIGSSTIDNLVVADAGTGTDPQDDADVADVVLTVHYDLALAKVAASPTIALGGQPTFQVRVYNQGNVPSGAVTVVDQLPTGLAFVAVGTTAGCVAATGNTVSCSIAGIAAGGSTLLTIVTTPGSDYGTAPWTNWAEIATDSGMPLYGVTDADSTPQASETAGTTGHDSTPPTDAYVDVPAAGATYVAPTGTDEDDNDAATVGSSLVYDLALVKTANATHLTDPQHATITYTITVQNQGNVASGTYHVTDTLPAGLSAVTPIAGGGTTTAGPPATVVWTGTSLAPGGSAVFTLVVNVDDLTQRPFRNIAEISSDSASSLYGLADVDSTPDAIATNDNAGNGVTTGDGYGPAGSPDTTVDNLTIAESGNGNDGEDDADIADIGISLVDGYDLALAKTVDSSTAAYDGVITFTITVQNQGVLDARQFTVLDTLPAGLTPIDLDGGVDTGLNTITWTIADLAAGATTSRTLQVEVADITLRPFRNVAEISSDSSSYYEINGDPVDDADSTPDANPTNDGTYGAVMLLTAADNTGSDAITRAGVGLDTEDDADIADVDVPVVYDLALVKTGPAIMEPTGSTTFTITVANQGNVPSGQYSVTDIVPAGMTVTAASDGATAVDPTAAVVWTALPSLLPGATATLTVTMSIADLSLRPFRNSTEITADSASAYSTGTVTVADVDSVPNDLATSTVDNTTIGQAGTSGDAGFDDEDTANVTTGVVYDLALVKTVGNATTTFDGTETFTIVVANQGNVPSGAYTVVDAVPFGLSVVSASDGGVVAGQTVTWNLTGLGFGTTRSLTVVVHVTDVTKRPFRNSAEITSDSATIYSAVDDVVRDVDSVPGDGASSSVDATSIAPTVGTPDDGFDDEDVAMLDVPITYDLALIKRLPPGQSFARGNIVRFEILVKNQGNVPSGNYSVHDVLPNGLGFVNAGSGGTFPDPEIRWIDLPSLPAGASATLTVDVMMNDPAMPSYVNNAEITADGAGTYSTPGTTVHDVDSAPDDDPADDLIIDTDDVDLHSAADEDDSDIATLPIDQVIVDNLPPPPATGALPTTGTDATLLLSGAVGMCLLGGGLLVGRRRRAARRGQDLRHSHGLG